jgi:hypothetical protein
MLEHGATLAVKNTMVNVEDDCVGCVIIDEMLERNP